jgi:hypothetical protein
MAVKVEPRKPPSEPPAEPTISVFLYQVTPDTALRGSDLPTRAADGTLVKRPVTALDLHYLITAYGDETELVGQRLLGSVVRTLHEIPVLPKDIIELAGERPYLAGSDLAGTAQRVRFTPTVMDVDETSKLWGMLYQTPYSLSVVYQAAVVLIDGREAPVPGRPVQRPDVRVLPFGAPGAPVPAGAGVGAGVGTGAGAGTGRTADLPPADAAPGARDAAGQQETAVPPARKGARKTAKPPAKAATRATTKAAAKSAARATTKAAAKSAAAKATAKPATKAVAKSAAKKPGRPRTSGPRAAGPAEE